MWFIHHYYGDMFAMVTFERGYNFLRYLIDFKLFILQHHYMLARQIF